MITVGSADTKHFILGCNDLSVNTRWSESIRGNLGPSDFVSKVLMGGDPVLSELSIDELINNFWSRLMPASTNPDVICFQSHRDLSIAGLVIPTISILNPESKCLEDRYLTLFKPNGKAPVHLLTLPHTQDVMRELFGKYKIYDMYVGFYNLRGLEHTPSFECLVK